MLYKLDYNSRLAPSLEPEIKSIPNDYTLERLGNAVLPILAMIPVCSLVLQVLAAGKSTCSAFEDNDNKLKNCAVAVSQIASIALLCVNPLAVSVVQQTTDIFQNIIVAGNHILQNKYKQAFAEILNVADKYVFVASILVGGPQLILISMISRAVFEVYKLKQTHDKELHLESFVQVVMIVARVYGLSQHIQKHGEELKSSFVSLKSKSINQIEDISESSLIHSSLKRATYFYSYATNIVWNGGYKFHVADYLDGTRIVTCLNGALEGMQSIFYYGVRVEDSFNFSVHRDYVEHKFSNGKVYTYSDHQVVKVN